jgi:hypothetical protein
METVHSNLMTGEVMTLAGRHQHLRSLLQDRDREIALLGEEMTCLTPTKKSFHVILAKILDGQAQVMAYLADHASTFLISRKQPHASSSAAPQAYHN